MLTGVDTVADAFTVTAHRHGSRPALVGVGTATTWAQLGGTVRLLGLGLGAAGVGPESRVHVAVRDPAGRRALELALVCVGAVRVGAPTPDELGARAVMVLAEQDLGSLRAAGAPVDEADPDQFERRTRSVDADAPAVEDGPATLTQRQLLWAARSLAASVAATEDDRVLSTLPAEGVTGWVCGALLAVVSGAAAAVTPASDPSTLAAVRPTLLVCGDEDVAGLGVARPASAPSAWVRGLARLGGRGRAGPPGLEECRAAFVVGGGGAGAAWLAAAGVPARTAATWPGHAGLVTGAAGPLGGLGRPLPGVTIGIDDDGEVLVRSESVADGWCDDGWLHTGWTGEIDAAGRLSAVAGPPGGSR